MSPIINPINDSCKNLDNNIGFSPIHSIDKVCKNSHISSKKISMSPLPSTSLNNTNNNNNETKFSSNNINNDEKNLSCFTKPLSR
jgi:hypothetical protein